MTEAVWCRFTAKGIAVSARGLLWEVTQQIAPMKAARSRAPPAPQKAASLTLDEGDVRLGEPMHGSMPSNSSNVGLAGSTGLDGPGRKGTYRKTASCCCSWAYLLGAGGVFVGCIGTATIVRVLHD